jgi:hypothetical protein
MNPKSQILYLGKKSNKMRQNGIKIKKIEEITGIMTEKPFP